MDLYVFNTQLEFIGVIDTYHSFIFERYLTKPGSCTLTLTFDSDAFALLQDDHIIAKENDLKDACYISHHSIEQEENGHDKLIVKGFSLANLLRKRIVWGTQRYTGDIDKVMKEFVDKNVIHPVDSRRVLPGFSLSPTKTFGNVAEVSSYKYLPDCLEDIAEKNDVGWRVLLDLEKKQYVFDPYRGRNLTTEQDTIDPVIFSTENENVINQRYVYDQGSYANTVLVAGSGEGTNRKVVTINNDKSGWERIELFVDARDLSDQGEDGNPIDSAVYNQMLMERGQKKLLEAVKIESFESEIDANSQYVYREDYDLGDRVTVMNRKWGIVMHPRITAVTETYQKGTVDINVEFGTNIPTLIDVIKRKLG
ncbi:TPA: siphovirus ReqiPepy6 Gp37-like family protein [Bacillus cereus]|uniref:siphovirus ReqiPepy6 Gp37-like family protein n=2 Tax=Bacteria TaxID=2 RepID=UPI001C2F31EB|nr:MULTISPECIES: siphovirus ReqiPepy6 Gp37-like family protein [Bacillales]MCP1284041.1 siphovirus ReqiPepy6 Gp37-like family protein [Bacillus sp. S0635]MCQ6349666.1 siphovirus ReqiPepy6 Gp37-like family protein [Bacillus cereus]HDX9631836.1 siphovirus ReqiPepy6 Gp37-like family protein [Bacillus cereus]